MRLGKPRGGGGTVTSRVTPARHDLKGNQRHRQKYGRGAPGNHPGYAPLLHADEYALDFCNYTLRYPRLNSADYFDNT